MSRLKSTLVAFTWCHALLLALLLSLLGAAQAFGTPGQVLSHQKVSDSEGGFTGELHEQDYFGISGAALAGAMFMGLGDSGGGGFYSSANGVSADGSVVVGRDWNYDAANWEAFR
jgi:uncharacterized membrane protein